MGRKEPWEVPGSVLLAAGRAANKDKSNSTAGEKADMKSDEVNQLTTRAIEQLCTALSPGCSEELTRYLAAMSRSYRYSLHNVMLITLQKPTATHVAGVHAWSCQSDDAKRSGTKETGFRLETATQLERLPDSFVAQLRGRGENTIATCSRPECFETPHSPCGTGVLKPISKRIGTTFR
jgi:hypothetical protein